MLTIDDLDVALGAAKAVQCDPTEWATVRCVRLWTRLSGSLLFATFVTGWCVLHPTEGR